MTTALQQWRSAYNKYKRVKSSARRKPSTKRRILKPSKKKLPGKMVRRYHVEFPNVTEAELKRLYRLERRLPGFDTGVLLVGPTAPRRDWEIDYDLKVKSTPSQIISNARRLDPGLMRRAKVKRVPGNIRWSKA